ncbi:replication protein [Pasteurella multocida]|uniref:replication protein n=1 Tax=Pasteurella multocida TaxID=747 RepID=UPI002B482FBE|nr:replication protein [Pasteurella multocida]WRK07332.1 replication protein [Pasteurella multocida]
MSNVLRLDDYREKIAQEKPIKEVKKVSIDDGFTAIPNELLESILKSGVLGWKGSYLLATVLKTLKWHKQSDWFSHSQVCEMMGIEANKYHINQLSAARSELIKAKILFEKGRNTGVNLAVFEWSMIIPDKVGKSRKSRDLIPENVGNTYPENVGNTKETLTKEKINITPLPPKGESANADGVPVAENKKQRSLNIDYVGIGKAYNQCVAETGKNLPSLADPENLSQARKRKIKILATVMKKRFGSCDAETFKNYFLDFMKSARSFYFGENDRGWRADFEYIVSEKIMDKTIEGSL